MLESVTHGMLNETTLEIEQGRLRLREDAACQFVDASTFCKLIVGRQTLTRCDDESLNLLGVVDIADGTRYVIESETLQRHLDQVSDSQPSRAQMPLKG